MALQVELTMCRCDCRVAGQTAARAALVLGFLGENRWPIMEEPMEGFLESDLWAGMWGVSTSVPSVSVLAVGADQELQCAYLRCILTSCPSEEGLGTPWARRHHGGFWESWVVASAGGGVLAPGVFLCGFASNLPCQLLLNRSKSSRTGYPDTVSPWLLEWRVVELGGIWGNRGQMDLCRESL